MRWWRLADFLQWRRAGKPMSWCLWVCAENGKNSLKRMDNESSKLQNLTWCDAAFQGDSVNYVKNIASIFFVRIPANTLQEWRDTLIGGKKKKGVSRRNCEGNRYVKTFGNRPKPTYPRCSWLKNNKWMDNMIKKTCLKGDFHGAKGFQLNIWRRTPESWQVLHGTGYDGVAVRVSHGSRADQGFKWMRRRRV